MKLRAFGLTALLLAGCGRSTTTDGEGDSAAATGDAIALDWSEGDRFYVAARYREGAVKAEERPVTIEDAEAAMGDTFAEHWTDEVVWTYQVVESGYLPEVDDELYEYAVTGAGEVTPLAVVKVTAEAALNADPEVLAADPTTYLVFREDTDRMVGLISFTTVGSERIEQAWSAGERGRSWSVLSQGNLVKAPTYLAPWSAQWDEGERRLESGRTVETVVADDGAVDVFYSDELDGGLVGSRYEEGQPWPTWTVAENVESRLLDATEVDGLRGPVPPPDGDEDFDYRRVLASSIDIDAALRIDADTIADAGWDAEVREQVRPWAGAWWPLKKGELVFGYRYQETLSDRIQEDIDPLKTDMDRLSEEIRDMDKEAEGRQEKVEEYQAKQKELVEKLVEFYEGVQSDLDAGRLRVEDGKLVHDDDWSVEIEHLSPMDKFALVEHLSGNDYPNPWFLPAWEILNSYNPGGDSWWGHCNGWAAAAILTNEPTESRTVTVDGQDIEFSTADIKGLLTESHYSTYSRFYGERYNGEDDDLTDLTPSAFQRIVTFYIKEQGVPLVFDTTATEAVWNFPAWKVELTLDETTEAGALDKVDVNTAKVDALGSLPGIGETLAIRIIAHREKNGPFQDIDGLAAVDGIGDAAVDGLRDLATVDPVERTFDAMARVTLTTDGVDEEHIDEGLPESFTESWGYTLVTDADGTVLRGTWDREDKHPDFAWVPYSNPHKPQNGGSENPYLNYGHLLEQLGEDIERH
jgi:competence ComEA-like helix-hairpin-helix protein